MVTQKQKHSIVVLLLLAASLILIRWPSFKEPLEHDITTYAVMAHEWLQGRSLYSDLWDHKPPAVYWIFAAAEKLAGYGPKSIFLLNILAGLVTLVGLFGFTFRWTQDHRSGWWAAAFWVILGTNIRLQANQPNTEVFLNSLGILFLWALIHGTQQKAIRWPTLLLIGVTSALASLIKPNMVLPLALAVGVTALDLSKESRLRLVGMFALSVLGAWSVVMLSFASRGTFHHFSEAVFQFNAFYSQTNAPTFLIRIVRICFLWSHQLLFLFGSEIAWGAALVLAGGAIGSLKGPTLVLRSGWKILFAYAVGLLFYSPVPWRFIHYLQPWLPLICAAIAVILLHVRERFGHSWANLSGALILGCLVWREAPFYKATPSEWSVMKYGTTRSAVAADCGRFLGERLRPGETIYNFGADSELYFYSQRSPAAGVFYQPLYGGGPLSATLMARTMDQLQAHPPTIIAISDWKAPRRPREEVDAFLRWTAIHYEPLPEKSEWGDVLRVLRRKEVREVSRAE